MLRVASQSFVRVLALLALSVGGLLSRAHADLTLYGAAFSSDFFDPNNNSSTLYNINPTTGAATTIGSIGYRLVGGLAFDSAGTLYGVGATYTNPGGGPPPVGDLTLITVNTATGAGTAVGTLTVGGSPLLSNFQDISFNPTTGTLYGYASGQAYTIDKTTGVATALPHPTGESEIGGGLAFTPDGSSLYKAGFDHLVSINTSTGESSEVQFSPTNNQLSYPTGGTPNITGMSYANGVLWAAVHVDDSADPATYLATVNTATGLITKIGDSVNGLTALAAIPEPSTYGVLAGVALVGIGMGSSVARRKKAVTA